MSKEFRMRRSFAVTVALVAALAMMASALWLLAAPIASHADGPDRADIVVQFDDTHAIVRGAQFTAPVSGLQALYLTGLDVITKDMGWGIAVCSIEGVGCPASDCFCSSTKYWGYNYWDGSAWQGYSVGAADSVLNDGAIDGWRWGEWGDTMVPAPQMTATARALEWLHAQQQADGGYGSVGATVEAMLAIGANGYTAAEWRSPDSGVSLNSYILANGASFVTSPASAGKLAVAVAATDVQYPVGATRPISFYNPISGTFSTNSGDVAWAILGLRAMNLTVPAPAVSALKAAQQADGGWEWSPGWGTDTNTSSLALEALVSAGEPLTSTTIISGFEFLKTAQNTDGGFTYSPTSPWGTDSDTNSTAYVVQALKAIHQPVPLGGSAIFGSLPITGTTPISYLLGMQLSSGAFEWQPGTGENLLATQQAVPGLLERPFPLATRDISDGIVVPTGGGTITSTVGVTITIDSNVFTDTIQFYFTVAPGDAAQFGSDLGALYELNAFFADSGLPAQPQPGQTYTITVSYDESQLPAGFDESMLALYYWNNGQWVREVTSVVDTVANVITATPNHFSLWAALARYNTYLPLIFK